MTCRNGSTTLPNPARNLDKLEAIPGFRTDLSVDEFRAQLKSLGLCFIGQTEEIAPADKKLYALRDVTATIENRRALADTVAAAESHGEIQLSFKQLKCARSSRMSPGSNAIERGSSDKHGPGTQSQGFCDV